MYSSRSGSDSAVSFSPAACCCIVTFSSEPSLASGVCITSSSFSVSPSVSHLSGFRVHRDGTEVIFLPGIRDQTGDLLAVRGVPARQWHPSSRRIRALQPDFETDRILPAQSSWRQRSNIFSIVPVCHLLFSHSPVLSSFAFAGILLFGHLPDVKLPLKEISC